MVTTTVESVDKMTDFNTDSDSRTVQTLNQKDNKMITFS